MSRRMAVIGTAVAVLLIALAGVATGASSSQSTTSTPAESAGSPVVASSPVGRVLYLGSMGCDLRFGFRGFAPGTEAQIRVSWLSTSRMFHFTLTVPDSTRVVNVSSILGLGGHRQVRYAATARDAEVSAVGMARVHCNCQMGGGGGGGGSGGGSGSGGGITSGGAAATAGPAQPIDAQPSFTG